MTFPQRLGEIPELPEFLVIARSKATKQSIGDFTQCLGLLRFARNDDQNQYWDTRDQFLSAS
jgi:hypothetical protein